MSESIHSRYASLLIENENLINQVAELTTRAEQANQIAETPVDSKYDKVHRPDLLRIVLLARKATGAIEVFNNASRRAINAGDGEAKP
ncbi:hypothetical protein [Sporomusa sphaeroides]|uniref:FlgN protein n=1 Tax=Sporomusa sphaeroides DSM 2875 TaxID=1337886 RepID=A0ABP2C1Y2_9FIRM|nr:hypothetical protein [Sporomusa sphaeroides]OLS56384.1 hypothetical protein SPSPH_27770 [Sporomusa sphaeroides DSM 2875]CVK18479.1 hypothetical protein SSPH_01117 [Sporomusa sphaeroides DSM 2875]